MNSIQLTNTRLNHQQQGFTLIEIAIVLVIIGLLLGGVLKGQELINTARVRALNNTVDGITAAWFSFQDRYRAFPGDYNQADINLPGAPANPADATKSGNGQIDADDERSLVWVHLSAAGYLTGGYTPGTIAADEYACPIGSCPDNGFGAGMNLSFGSEALSAASNTHELISGRGIPVEVLAELDRKVDDGVPDTGAMQLGNGASSWTAACILAGNYDLQSPVDNCAAVFRVF